MEREANGLIQTGPRRWRRGKGLMRAENSSKQGSRVGFFL